MLKGDVHTRYAEHFMNSLKDGFIQWSLKAVIITSIPTFLEYSFPISWQVYVQRCL